MSDSSSSFRAGELQEILLGLRDLQRRLDELVVTAGTLSASTEACPAEASSLALDIEPEIFWRPLRQPVIQQPVRGTSLDKCIRFYAGSHRGWVLLAQRPAVGSRTGRFELGINFREFDGEWMSIVFDLRAALKTEVAGGARLLVSTQVDSFPRSPVQFKCGWRHAGQESQARQTAVLEGETLHFQLDLGPLRPQELEALELHVIFPVSGRGAIYLRSLRASLLLTGDAEGSTAADPDVFEDAP